jgi:hypothetical protein
LLEWEFNPRLARNCARIFREATADAFVLAISIHAWRETAAHGVLANRSRLRELQQVVGAASFATHAAHAKAAKRLPANKRASNSTIDI